jgi:hypothetical protein
MLVAQEQRVTTRADDLVSLAQIRRLDERVALWAGETSRRKKSMHLA